MSALLPGTILAAAPGWPSDAGGWVLLAGLVVLAALLLALLAVLAVRREPWDLEGTPGAFLAIRKAYEKTLRTLKDLEFDLQTGGLTAEEHAALKAEYKRRAVGLRRALERSRHAAFRRIAAGARLDMTAEERRALEEQVARRRKELTQQ